ncbi:hypothetical protein NECAME_17123 [Necator americanus]|uniref:Uncharacterized protein n=1 Tax=Necator americanus TaxID=51031 RepID=W2TS60_NECAM|nr:hypothetical protein NECAME_17123 [Necator americanus]ETN84509.1 hypothetical protein NECAME_17123 [Necator americanus]
MREKLRKAEGRDRRCYAFMDFSQYEFIDALRLPETVRILPIAKKYLQDLNVMHMEGVSFQMG